MVGWLIFDSDDYAVRFWPGAQTDSPPLESGEYALFSLIPYEQGELRCFMTKAIVGEAVGTGDGTSTIFWLGYCPVKADTQTIKVNGVTKTEGVDYTFEDASGRITFASAPDAELPITADYTAVKKRPLAGGSLDKTSINADGVDTATLTVTIEDQDSVGVPASVAYTVMSVTATVTITAGSGTLPITADLPATIDITCGDKHVAPWPARHQVVAS